MKIYEEKEIRKIYSEITKKLIKENLTITTMESATSGQIASLITDTEGASAIMKGAFITYSNEAKVKQGVPVEIIEKYGVYSKETAIEMAKACVSAYNANIGIGITGTMGNVDHVNADSIPGQVYFAIYFNGDIKAYYIELPVQDSRFDYKMAVAKEISDVLLNNF